MSPDETPAVLLRRDGSDAVPATPGVERLLRTLGYAVTEQMSTVRAEHNRFHVGPETVEAAASAVETTGADCVVVDNDLHPGQAADLLGALPPVTLRDRRTLVFDSLGAAGNAVAENRAERRRLRVERRRLANESRADRADARVADIDRRCDRLDDALADLVAERRHAVEQTHAGTGARVVLAERLGADRGLWAAVAGGDGEADRNPLAPGEVATDAVALEPGPVAVTRVPGLVDGFPAWYRETVPGTVAAVERADCLVLGTDAVAPVRGTVRALREQTNAPILLAPAGAGDDHGGVDSTDVSVLAAPTADRLRGAVVSSLPTSRLSVTLPYTDDAHALVAWLHDSAAVETVDYGDHIAVTVTALPDTTEEIRRRVAALDGIIEAA
jgi:GTP-binding protein HflX